MMSFFKASLADFLTRSQQLAIGGILCLGKLSLAALTGLALPVILPESLSEEPAVAWPSPRSSHLRLGQELHLFVAKDVGSLSTSSALEVLDLVLVLKYEMEPHFLFLMGALGRAGEGDRDWPPRWSNGLRLNPLRMDNKLLRTFSDRKT